VSFVFDESIPFKRVQIFSKEALPLFPPLQIKRFISHFKSKEIYEFIRLGVGLLWLNEAILYSDDIFLHASLLQNVVSVFSRPLKFGIRLLYTVIHKDHFFYAVN